MIQPVRRPNLSRFSSSILAAIAMTVAGCAPRSTAVAAQSGGAGSEASPVAEALARADAGVAAIVKSDAAKRNFDSTLGALDDVITQLRLDTELTQFMTYVSTSADERAKGQKAEEDVTNWMIALGKREDLYQVIKAYADTKHKLEGEQKRLLEQTMRDYRRAGMELPADKREKLKQLEMDTVKVGLEFDKNIRDDETRVPLTAEELKGLPEDVLKGLKSTSGVYLVGMDYPTYQPVMDYCDNETTRKKVWLAYKRRGGRKNVQVLENMVKMRAQAAAMLGYASTAAYQTEVRMAKTPEAVWRFYEKVRPLVRKKAELDFAEFTAAKRAHTGDAGAKFYPWDFDYYKDRLLKDKYAVDSEKVQEYFPVDAVVNGLFSVTQSLYGIEYRDATAKAAEKKRPLWHPDVKLYEVYDKADGKLLGEFYIDLYPREGKYTHAACWGLAPRKVWNDGHVSLPLAAMVCNFPKATADKPALLPHSDVETFFHEFGHCLHNILSNVHYGQFAGAAVARDFVEAPSQMFEHWVWDADVLKTFSRHYKTGQPLPKELLDGMVRAKNLGSGIFSEHQFYYGLTDFTYHTKPDGVVDTTKVAQELFPQVELYDAVPEIFYQASFGHLNGYAAAYYGYQWSKVYGEDMFQRFKELGMLDPKAGKYYREKILARGGTLDEIDMVRDYLGREPKMDAYLAALGLEVK